MKILQALDSNVLWYPMSQGNERVAIPTLMGEPLPVMLQGLRFSIPTPSVPRVVDLNLPTPYQYYKNGFQDEAIRKTSELHLIWSLPHEAQALIEVAALKGLLHVITSGQIDSLSWAALNNDS